MIMNFFRKTLCVFVAVFFLLVPLSSAFAEQQEEVWAPDLSLNALDGREVSLQQYRGKYVLLNFWATWCGPCKMEMPSLERLHQRFKSKNLEVVAVSNDMFGARVVVPYIKANRLSFTILLDQKMRASSDYGVVSLPTTYLIDPQGRIIGALYGAENWDEPSTLKYFEELLTRS